MYELFINLLLAPNPPFNVCSIKMKMNPGNTFPLPAGICYTGLLSFIRRILERHWRKGLVCPLEGLLYAHGFSSVRL